jgi:SAM-dependent methyltransferase
MNESADGSGSPAGDRSGDAERYYKRDFWSAEHAKFVQPHFRLEKCARIINRIARGKGCDLLDVGCGPATLSQLLDQNIRYYGIDLAINIPAPNLIEADFLESPIKFNDRDFDIVVAQGVFEYLGDVQSRKFSEIRDMLREGGVFIVSYTNFGHRRAQIDEPYSNIRSFDDFRQSLEDFFRIDKFFPASHNWHHGQPNRQFMKTVQKHLNMNIPLVSPVLAVEYFFICSRRRSELPPHLSKVAVAIVRCSRSSALPSRHRTPASHRVAVRRTASRRSPHRNFFRPRR